MMDALDLRSEDRLLLLSVPDAETVAALAARLERGLLVALGSPEQVSEARRSATLLENVMFTPARLEEIPWRDGYFSRIHDPLARKTLPTRALSEIVRVLSPGGLVLLEVEEAKPLLEAGLILVDQTETFSLFRKPETSAYPLPQLPVLS